ncbi:MULTISPECIES: beta-ketoacyl synthase N-terminal-like domain-containing protein [Methylosinus]|uniref:Beta-ketoacyl synthase n=1 Tax=Methylosinus trichosporium (strain ATCC 35070 / NCIMB 11131 / UNIQEM 75 / OB3b) TaxID=595536 RepID=A0A2D2D804_METT3|nr:MULTISPECIES: beta-ketoacyl synthase N-terminal-like domain-containing protein [Methylosinus]ATQ70969.1 beta-ketoacyl synthase [Methylosinus trichosporium OB3b]OBS53330.1 beta-ketoacyl synthase [Methylosinus sp. 3S-1]
MNAENLRSLVEKQLTQSRRLKARLRELENETRAPLAVIGMGLRLPGGIATPEDYWRFLCGEGDALSEVPEDRPGLRAVYDARPDRPGRSYVKRAGFLDDVAAFDAKFFGVSQREAEALDPQQRLLLETAWEALERAGIAARRGDRLPVGVFVGVMASEYGERRLGRADKRDVDPYFGTGGGHCFAAGRISYVMGFCGPALAVDTACSSSLVALQLAAQSLRRRECRYALVGGANMLFSPDLMVSLCQSRALAPDGRSKTFTAAADGYGRGEGVGVIALMRLDEAEREGRPILAVLRGVAVNHDGASSGLTVPSGPAQREVIAAALADAGARAEEIGYVEAHGTGTALGDPIEIGALDATLGGGAAERRAPLVLGSVKTRIGHLEAASGIAGVIKLILMLRHGEIPAALSEADGPLNPMVPWDRMPIVVPRETLAWPPGSARRLAGVSAFGLSGTNAHAVFEAAPAAPTAAPAKARRELIVLSARDAAALQILARSVAPRLAAAGAEELAAIAHTLRAGRAPLPYRLAVTGATGAEAAAALTRAAEAPLSAGASAPSVRLRLGSAGAAIEPALLELARVFPSLTPDEDASAGPELRLDRILRRLGLRAKILRDAEPVAAQLEWGHVHMPLATRDAGETPQLLLDALAALFVAGADLRFDTLCAPGARFIGDLPTYPFRRERFWIEEIDEPTPSLQGEAAALGFADIGGEDGAPLRDELDIFLAAELKELLRAEEELDRSQSFFALGGDSFIAMLLKKSVEQAYGVDLPLEALATDLPLDSLFAQIGDHVLAARAPADEELAL